MGQKRIIKKIFILTLLMAISAVMLTIIQPPFRIAFLAWLSLVPFIFASAIAEKTKQALTISYIVSAVYWLCNIYWLAPVTVGGYILLGLYLGIYWPVITAIIRYCIRRNAPLWLIFPVIIVGAEAIQGWLFKGFAWRYLAHSQFENITIIQIADIFGAPAVSFIIAMANAAIAEVFIGWHKHKRPSITVENFTGLVLTSAVIIASVFYGRWRIAQTPCCLSDGLKVAVVQSNVPVLAGEEFDNYEKTFLNMLVESRKAFLTAKPDLIVWPETMVEAVLSDCYLKGLDSSCSAVIFNNALKRHANEGINLLIGSFSADCNDDTITAKYNTAFLYEPNSPQKQQYSKVNLVPFGEYLPFKNSLPSLYKFMLSISPYDYDYSLDAGDSYTIFEIFDADKTNKYKFGTLICYEDTFGYAAKDTAVAGGVKQADFLVNISNDGWFVKKKGDKILPSVELSQHTACCVFRAVENRLPIVRSVNTGISCVIDSLGQISRQTGGGSLDSDYLKRQTKAGWLADNLKIDKRVSLFSKSGRTPELGAVICFIFAGFMSIYRKETKKQNTEGKK